MSHCWGENNNVRSSSGFSQPSSRDSVACDAVELERIHQPREHRLEPAKLIEAAFELQAIQRAVPVDKENLFSPIRAFLGIVVAILGEERRMTQELQLALFEDL